MEGQRKGFVAGAPAILTRNADGPASPSEHRAWGHPGTEDPRPRCPPCAAARRGAPGPLSGAQGSVIIGIRCCFKNVRPDTHEHPPHHGREGKPAGRKEHCEIPSSEATLGLAGHQRGSPWVRSQGLLHRSQKGGLFFLSLH